ncbi:hypothetical protein V8F33_003635 [Rhypophila sp. PSN 637]
MPTEAASLAFILLDEVPACTVPVHTTTTSEPRPALTPAFAAEGPTISDTQESRHIWVPHCVDIHLFGCVGPGGHEGSRYRVGHLDSPPDGSSRSASLLAVRRAVPRATPLARLTRSQNAFIARPTLTVLLSTAKCTILAPRSPGLAYLTKSCNCLRMQWTHHCRSSHLLLELPVLLPRLGRALRFNPAPPGQYPQYVRIHEYNEPSPYPQSASTAHLCEAAHSGPLYECLDQKGLDEPATPD